MAKKIIIRKPLDRWGNQISYVTTSSSVYDKEGNNLDQLLAKIDTEYVRKTSITQELGESEDLVMGKRDHYGDQQDRPKRGRNGIVYLIARDLPERLRGKGLYA